MKLLEPIFVCTCHLYVWCLTQFSVEWFEITAKTSQKSPFYQKYNSSKNSFWGFLSQYLFPHAINVFDVWLKFLSSDLTTLQKPVRKVPFLNSTAALKTHFEAFGTNICFHMPSICLMCDSIFCRMIWKYCKNLSEKSIFWTVQLF